MGGGTKGNGLFWESLGGGGVGGRGAQGGRFFLEGFNGFGQSKGGRRRKGDERSDGLEAEGGRKQTSWNLKARKKP